MQRSQIFASSYPVGMLVLCTYQNLALAFHIAPFLKRGNEGKEEEKRDCIIAADLYLSQKTCGCVLAPFYCLKHLLNLPL